MPTVSLSPTPRQLFLNPSNGAPASGFQLFTYAAGTTTKQNTYTDATGLTPNTNPIILDSLGECDLWLDVTLSYKYVFSPPTDTDPPTAPIWTRDNISVYGGPVTSAGSLPGFIGGLQMGAAGSTGIFSVNPGSASDSTAVFIMKLASASTKTTAAWAVGSGNGSLDSGSIANSTWYHVYLMARLDTNIVDIIASLSATAPTLPANYTIFRRIGSMLTDSSAHWTKFSQFGNYFTWATGGSEVNATITITQSLHAVTVPTGINVIARLRGLVQYTANGSALALLITSPSETGLTSNLGGGIAQATTGVYLPASGNTNAAFAVDVLTNTSAQVNAVSSSSGISTPLLMGAYGWIDLRGAM